MTLALIPILPLLGAVLPPLLFRFGRTAAALAAAIVAGTCLVLLLQLAPRALAGEIVTTGWTWMPALGINATFRLDGLGLMFAILILGIGLLIILYANYYLSEKDPIGRFYGFLLLFMSAMLGIVLSENVILLFMFWELTSLSSFLLIGYWSHRADARQGARMALTVTGGGGLALLGGLVLLGHVSGSFELSVILDSGDLIKNHPLYPLALVLILLGAFTKSAQFPFHFWLPHAMAAPTPVSAYLHSATMVKAGVFLLARFFPALAGTELWFIIVGSTGLATMLFAAYIALFKHDLKGLLAYSTISHLGLITLLFGLSTPLGEIAAVFHIMNHATFKASLFMATGIIDHECGTRDMRRINGLFKYMPYTAVLAMIAAGAMAGVPLLNGFLSKEMFFGETLAFSGFGGWDFMVPVIATLYGVFSVAYSSRFIHDVFFNGEPVDLPRTPHEPPRWMKIPVEVLVLLCVMVGIFPAFVIGTLLEAAAGSVLLGQPLPEYSLHVWHGFNLALLMSLLAMAGGVLMYSQRQFLFDFHDNYLMGVEGKTLFDKLLAALTRIARHLTATLENGSLQRYVALLFVSALVAGAAAFWPGVRLTGTLPTQPLGIDGALGGLILAIAAISTVLLHRKRLIALIPMSVVGLFCALIFTRFAGPDLALTQLAVEFGTTILLLLALYFLPQSTPPDGSIARRLRDAAISLLAGLGVAALTWAVLTRPDASIAEYFLDNSVAGGGGTNVVNVILVDFRGFDTLGEITVLAIAALGIAAMLSGLRLRAPAADPSGRVWTADLHPLILRVIARPLLPLALLTSVYLFLRGHNLPGGGFVAGLVTGVALVLQFMASGIRWTEERVGSDFRPTVALGLLFATLTGLASWVFGYPFLTSTHTHVHWPIVGDFELASALAFDLGVYLTVVGVILIILTDLSRLGEASRTARSVPATVDPWEEKA